MNGEFIFADREQFRNWLKDNCKTSGGVWLVFGKSGGVKTLTAVRIWSKPSATCGGTLPDITPFREHAIAEIRLLLRN